MVPGLRDSGGRRVEEWQDDSGGCGEEDGDGRPGGDGQAAAAKEEDKVAEEVKVRRMSEDSQSSHASLGAKVFPQREVVAGNRDAESIAEDLARQDLDHEVGVAESVEQQLLVDTQLDMAGDLMDTEEGDALALGADVAAVAAAVAMGDEAHDGEAAAGMVEADEGAVSEGAPAEAAGASTERGSDGSFGDGRVQSNLERWLL